MSSTLSFEVFPPNTQVGANKLFKTLKELQQLQPDFISVTCSNNRQTIEETTLKVADYIHNELKVPTIAHLPAVYLNQAQLDGLVKQLDAIGINQILALRGDILPELPPEKDFHYASDLIDYVKKEAPHFHISGACYPEAHPESLSRVEDIKNLKKKVSVGCEQLITQLFFDNELFYHFQEACYLADIKVPILAGIMPIVNRNQALRLIKTTQTKLPRKFLAILEKYEHDPVALKEAGLAYAIDQIVDLTTQDVAGIHLYTMNNAEVAKHIYHNTKNVLHGQVKAG
ncbi:methylenetetrahydrofolate reductase [NAD(P)H] [Enterococcus xiangfangensis]|uniref:methylenetetrahydrofolate reductase [NAD(P)H] n=1 Tax=Enterococcus xiangfangensis TaxID=1296537 RepID=UPI0010F88FD1|nr:methylenetetrahydrofolate reductase [NAD(P)H] [Enterococcus xiangfangensis]MBM7710877.1 methylenetetrahydrofolate reductase (NADPH) [Enterococcus xiangfangensis]